MTFELNLNDPATIEKLKATDVMAAPSPAPKADPAEVKDRIAELRKKHTFSMKLTEAQVEILSREGKARGIDWRAQLEYRILRDVFNGTVGGATISGPSYANGPIVTGPTGGLVRRG